MADPIEPAFPFRGNPSNNFNARGARIRLRGVEQEGGGRKAIDKLDSISTRRYVSPYHAARIEARGGNASTALDRLQLALRDESPLVSFVSVDPAFDGLRSDPRYAQILKAPTPLAPLTSLNR